jgi:CO/xanthine dehydrogenase FAD-binding subunit
MEGFEFVQPESLDAALAYLQQHGGLALAGGTDLLPGWRRGKPEPDCVVDLSRLDDLRQITVSDNRMTIGALCTHEQIQFSDAVIQHAPVLAQACATIGSRQTRERGTLGGNLANASPAADSAPALLVLDAELILQTAAGTRTITIDHFFTSPGKTCLADNELIIGVQFTLPDRHGGMGFNKLGRRKGMAISVASVAVQIEMEGGLIRLARVAMGSVAPTPIRCRKVENTLLGREPAPELFREAAGMVAEDITPITDLRASAEYRLRAAMVLVERTLTQTWDACKENNS